MSAITWQNLTNAGVVGATLSKTGGSSGIPNAGATSLQSLAGDGSITLTLPATTAELFIGLVLGGALVTDITQVPFAFHVYGTGAWDIRELNVYRTEGAYSAGDTLTITIAGDQVKYQHNGVDVLTSPTARPVGALSADVVFWTVGGSVSNGDLTDLSGGGGGTSIPTLAAATPTTQITAPTSYSHALTDLTALPVPALPALPADVNGTFISPSFNRTVRRATNQNTGPNANVSHRLPSSEQVCAWRRDSNGYITVDTFGGSLYHTLDQATGQVTYQHRTTFGQEPTFSRVAGREHILYGTSGYKVRTHDVDANTYADLIDLAAVDPAYTGGSLALGGSIQSSASTDHERIVFFYGGTSQDKHFRVCVFEVASPGTGLVLDTIAQTITPMTGGVLGAPVAVPMDHAFHVHAIGIDQSGRYVIVYPTGTDQSAGAAPMYAWDVFAGTVIGCSVMPWGHDSMGYGVWFNNAGDIGSPYDAFEFGYRSLADLAHYTKVINPQLTPQLVNMDTHPNWCNARSDAVTPPVLGTYLFYEPIAANKDTDPTHRTNTVAWRACDNEIVSVHPVSGAIYRWTHHFSDTYSDDGSSAGIGFWYEPIPQVSPNGRWILFASNMQKTLGLDADGSAQTLYRTDVWLIDTGEVFVPTVTVPDVTGLTETAAAAALSAAGLALGTVTLANSDTVPATDVISQLPLAGATASPGDAVALTVSIGVQPAPPPTPTINGTVKRTALPKFERVSRRVLSVQITKGVTEVDLTLYKGSRQDVVQQLDPVEDITGWTIVATIKQKPDDPNAIFTVPASMTDSVNGIYTIPFRASQSGLLAAGSYVWDVWRVDSGAEEVLMAPSKLVSTRTVRVP